MGGGQDADLRALDGTSLNVVLIHGTFGRKAEWLRPDSIFSTTLLARLDALEIFAFEWSGPNSHSARVKAAANLAGLLRILSDEYPGRQRVAIDHSHGGNVLRCALAQPKDLSALLAIVVMALVMPAAVHRDSRARSGLWLGSTGIFSGRPANRDSTRSCIRRADVRDRMLGYSLWLTPQALPFLPGPSRGRCNSRPGAGGVSS